MSPRPKSTRRAGPAAPAPAEASPLSEYLSDPDPAKRERAQNWRMAIGLQKVDGLSVSSFLLDLARKNIEGRMTNEEVRLAIDAHYSKKKRLTSSPPELPAT